MPQITCVEDLRQLHKKKAPRPFYEYVDTGSYTCGTYRSNTADLEAIKLRQRVGLDVSARSTESKLLGEGVRMPLAIGPTGLAGMQWADGEIHAARAAEKFGVPYTLPLMSICSIEDVAQATTRPFWFQLYVFKDKEFLEELLGRVKTAKCSALMVTLDTPILGQRHLDIKNGLSVPPRLTPAGILSLLARPAWGLRMLRAKRWVFANVVGHAKGVESIKTVGQWSRRQFDGSLNWNALAEIKKAWGGKLIIKGLQDPEDAKAAVGIGADAVIVSNHGGRQLDGAISSIKALPAVVAAVGGQTEVWMDGGIRSGQDVFKALALGAKGTLIGRAYNFGLGAMGGPGVTAALDIIRNELDVTMALCGVRTIPEIGRQVLL